MRSSRSMMPGAASHMSLIGGWLPRKSPPYTVSSKCCQVESPSPYRFFAALMPPCAHTECDRFTGTMENRSTSAPISAILITAASPARPPPTTMILGVAILSHRPSAGCTRVTRAGNVSARLVLLQRTRAERIQTGKSRSAQHQEKYQAHAQQPLLRLVPRRDAPLRAEQPDAIRKMPRSCHQSRHVEQEQPGVHHLIMDLG